MEGVRTQGSTGVGTDELERVNRALEDAERYLRSLQQSDGHWCGELEGDSILEAEYALLLWFLGRGDSGRYRQLANHLRGEQLPGGGWGNFPGGPPDVSVSTKCYFVLRLAGDGADEPHMAAARRVIRDLGGLDRTNSYTKILLAVFGVYEWRDAPAVPPELILLPRWFYFNIYAMSSWSRAIVVPLSVVWAHKPFCEVPEDCRLAELRVPASRQPPLVVSPRLRERAFRALFQLADRGLKALEDFGITPFRRIAMRRAEAWVEARLVDSDGLGAIFPSIMNTILAFVCRGRALGHPKVQRQLRELEKLEILDGDEMHLQPCFSPVWDTALALNALLECGAAADDPALLRGSRWLLDKEVRQVGDWAFAADSEPGGWFFEYANEFYPDCDDTAEVMAVLDRVRLGEQDDADRVAALGRAERWLRAMQSRNGGWGAFDRNCDRSVLEMVPFADHNAMIDPPTVDVSSRCIEALIARGADASDPAIRRGVRFIVSEQQDDGSWYGRWGANYIYGTWLALCGLHAAGESGSTAARRGVEWLLSVQQEGGGWGESLWSYHDPSTKGHGEVTASQTAWAILGLLAGGADATDEGSEAIRRGVRSLLETVGDDGTWYDAPWTATGFPGVFYLRYHLYACYFPLQALASYRRVLERRLGIEQAA